MITKQEVLEYSRKFGLPANVIEKDYVLGWLLAGIYANKNLSSKWVFKGGTCLKKCYFETYRFSEDLDFTLTDTEHLDNDFLVANLVSTVKWISNSSGIEIPAELVRFEIYENSRGGFSAVGKIGYRGPLQRRGNLARIKLDLTGDEILVEKPLERKVHHPYSDSPNGGINVFCYSYEEIFAEKIRALIERARPRDLYDVVHLYRHRSNPQLNLNHHVAVKILQNKCTHRKVELPKLSDIQDKLEQDKLKAEWENMLAHQLPVLPPFEQFWDELPILFEWIYGVIDETKPLPSITAGGLFSATIQNTIFEENLVLLEGIKFAAANHLCVEISYIKENGVQQHYLIEPYSLRRSRENNVLLYAVKHKTGENRAFRLDRIQETKVTTITFTPKYSVEIMTMPNIFSRYSSKKMGHNKPII